MSEQVLSSIDTSQTIPTQELYHRLSEQDREIRVIQDICRSMQEKQYAVTQSSSGTSGYQRLQRWQRAAPLQYSPIQSNIPSHASSGPGSPITDIDLRIRVHVDGPVALSLRNLTSVELRKRVQIAVNQAPRLKDTRVTDAILLLSGDLELLAEKVTDKERLIHNESHWIRSCGQGAYILRDTFSSNIHLSLPASVSGCKRKLL